jgi:transcriptional regulator with XRE-family HTH domain
MTHEDVAERAGIQRPYYTMIENGTRNPSVEVAKRIAKVMGFNWTLFFENEGSEVTHGSTGTDGK